MLGKMQSLLLAWRERAKAKKGEKKILEQIYTFASATDRIFYIYTLMMCISMEYCLNSQWKLHLTAILSSKWKCKEWIIKKEVANRQVSQPSGSSIQLKRKKRVAHQISTINRQTNDFKTITLEKFNKFFGYVETVFLRHSIMLNFNDKRSRAKSNI